jgi:hypothetical protein
MRRPLFWVAAIGTASVSNLALTYAVPNVVTSRAMPTEKSRAVVKPNPDLLFGVCVFDPAKGALGVSLRQPTGYWSIAVYRGDSTNAAVVSRRDKLQSTVALHVASAAGAGQDTIAVGPGKSAVILRILPQNPANADGERTALETFRCVHRQDAAK